MNNNVLWLNKLVPKHVLLDDESVESKLKPLNVTREQLPKILLKDPALKALDEEAKPGDVKTKIKKNRNTVFVSYRYFDIA